MESSQDVIQGNLQLKINKIVSCLFLKLKFLNELVACTCLVNRDMCLWLVSESCSCSHLLSLKHTHTHITDIILKKTINIAPRQSVLISPTNHGILILLCGLPASFGDKSCFSLHREGTPTLQGERERLGYLKITCPREVD